MSFFLYYYRTQYLNSMSSHSLRKNVADLSKFILFKSYSQTLILLSSVKIPPSQSCSPNRCQIDLM